MENNCLITKLKGVVDNNELLKLGELKFIGYAQGDPRLDAAIDLHVNSYSVTIRVIKGKCYYTDWEGGFHWVEVTTQKTLATFSTGVAIFANSGSEFTLDIKYKPISQYDMKPGISDFGDIADLKYSTLSGYIRTLKYGDFGFMKSSALNRIYLEGFVDPTYEYRSINVKEGLSGSYSTMEEIATYRADHRSEGLYTTDEFGEFTNMKRVTLINHALEGAIEDFVIKQRSKGRTTGTVTFWNTINMPYVTYNGTPFSSLGWNSSDVIWDATTITVQEHPIS